MEVREVERLQKTVEQHTQDINNLKLDNVNRDHKIDLLTQKVDGMSLQFSELKSVVKEDGTKTRDSMMKNAEKLDGYNQQLWEYMKTKDGYTEAAATRDHETKRTKLQTTKDVLVAILALIGTAIGGPIAIQEIFRLFP